MYYDPVTLPSIQTGDHLCVLLKPKEMIKNKVSKEKVMMRKFKRSAIIQFGTWITTFDWNEMIMLSDVNDKVAYFATITWIMIEKYFPLTPVIITNTDKEWMTPNIKKLISQRQKAHRLKKIKLRNNLAKKIQIGIKKAIKRYNKRKKNNLLSSSSKEWYRHINNIIGNKKSNINLALVVIVHDI